MKLSITILLSIFASAVAFVPGSQQRAFAPRPLFMSDEEAAAPPPPTPAPTPAPAPAKAPAAKGGQLVPIKEETVEFTAGILGGLAGLIVGGPVSAFILAAATNYASKTEGEAADIVNAISKSSIQVYNYLTTVDNKYEVLNKAKASLEKALDKLKASESVDPEAIQKVETALANTKSKIEEINDEYDLVGGATTALGIVGDLVEKAIKKAGELNEEYQLSDKAIDALKGAVDKAKAATKN